MKKTRVILILAFFAAACSQGKKEKVSSEPEVNELPPLTLTLVTGEKIQVNSLSGKTILFFFTPDCDHCQREAEAIRTHVTAEFKDYSIYFISGNQSEDGGRFAAKYRLTGYSNVLFAHAEVGEVMRIMGPIGTPTLYIYSSEKRLVKKFDRETSIEEIIKFL